ncbi:MAG: tRNA glutamyl-Q(34) synthetase GluQRS [Casimicrobiaceae bacterium]
MNAYRPRYRGRFAPSPTGPLHFGSLIAAVASYCDARAAGGEWLVRIEDIDLPRARPGAERAIMSALERYGFAWDGPVVRQSERSALYKDALVELRDRDDVYACACTRRELEAASIGAGGERVYPGTCRDGVPADRIGRSARAWRLRVGASRMAWRDRLQGTQTQDLARDVGDFVVQRADGLFAYQLAVVVDDDAQGITDVVRGADLMASTARQILLQQRLACATPSYLHVPIAIDAQGEKISKQTRAAPLPASPLPALFAAWRFLEQPLPSGSGVPATIPEFWQWSISAWNPARLPPVSMLPAPAAFRPDSSASV